MKPTGFWAALAAILFMGITVKGQFATVAEGPSFKEDTDAFYRLLAMKDGSVFVLAVNVDHGIDLQLYGPDHKMVTTTRVEPSYGKLKKGGVEKAFEINGDVVLMINELDDKVPVLYRVVIDGKTGKLKSEEKIAEMRKLKRGFLRVLSQPNEQPGKFYIGYSDISDSYAVAFCDDSESGDTKNITIIAYGGDHKEIKRGRYVFTDREENSLMLQDVNVLEPGNVNLLLRHASYPYTVRGGLFGKTVGSRKEKEMIAYIPDGSTEIKLVDLPFSEDSVMRDAKLRYNPHTKKLIMAAKYFSIGGKSNWNMSFIATIDPVTKQVENRMLSQPSNELIEKAGLIYGKEYVYNGTPEEVLINEDGTITVVNEHWYWYTNTSSRGTVVSYSLETYMIVVDTYDRSGKLIQNYMVPRSTSHSAANTFSYGSGFGNEFKKFFFIKGKNGDFVLINDTRRNIDKIADNQPPIQIMSTADCDAYYFPLSGKDVIPQRKYIFGEGEKKTDRTMAALGLSTYSKKDDLLVTIRKSNTEKFRDINVVWLKPQ